MPHAEPAVCYRLIGLTFELIDMQIEWSGYAMPIIILIN